MSLIIRRLVSPSNVKTASSISRYTLRNLHTTPFSTPRITRLWHQSRTFSLSTTLRKDGDDGKRPEEEADVSKLRQDNTSSSVNREIDASKELLSGESESEAHTSTSNEESKLDTKPLEDLQGVLADQADTEWSLRSPDEVKEEFAKLSPIEQRQAAAEWKMLKSQLDKLPPNEKQQYINSMMNNSVPEVSGDEEDELTIPAGIRGLSPNEVDLDSDVVPKFSDSELRRLGLNKDDIRALEGKEDIDYARAAKIGAALARRGFSNDEIEDLLQSDDSTDALEALQNGPIEDDGEIKSSDGKDQRLVEWQKATGITDAKLGYYLDRFGDFQRMEAGDEMVLTESIMEAMHKGDISEERVAELIEELGGGITAELALGIEKGHFTIETMQKLLESHPPDIAMAIGSGAIKEEDVVALADKYQVSDTDFLLAYLTNKLPRAKADEWLNRLGEYAPYLKLMEGLIQGTYSESSVTRLRSKYPGITGDTVADLVTGDLDASVAIPLLEKYGGDVITPIMVGAIEHGVIDELKIRELVEKYPGIWDALILLRVQKQVTAREIRQAIKAKREQEGVQASRDAVTSKPVIQLHPPASIVPSAQAQLGEVIVETLAKSKEATSEEVSYPEAEDPIKVVSKLVSDPVKGASEEELEVAKKALAGDSESIHALLELMRSRQPNHISDDPNVPNWERDYIEHTDLNKLQDVSEETEGEKVETEEIDNDDDAAVPWVTIPEIEPGEGAKALGLPEGEDLSDQDIKQRMKEGLDDTTRTEERELNRIQAELEALESHMGSEPTDADLAAQTPEQKAEMEQNEQAIHELMKQLQQEVAEMEEMEKEVDMPNDENQRAEIKDFMERNESFIDDLLSGKVSEESLLESAESFQEKYEEFVKSGQADVDSSSDSEFVNAVMKRMNSKNPKEQFSLKETMDLMAHPATMRIYKQMQDMGLNMDSSQEEILHTIQQKFANDEGRNTHYQDDVGNQFNVFYPRNVNDLKKIRKEIAAGRASEYASETGITNIQPGGQKGGPLAHLLKMEAPAGLPEYDPLPEPQYDEFFSDYVGRTAPELSSEEREEADEEDKHEQMGIFNYVESPDDPDKDAGEDDPPFEGDDLTNMGHGELIQHRDLREYARLAAWELPLLHKLKKPFNPPTESTPLRFRYTTYMGEEHPASRKVVLEFKPNDIPNLTDAQRIKLIKLVGPRYNPEKRTVKMSCESFETQAQNKRYLGDLVQKLVNEAQNGKDMFEDVPIDLRHHSTKQKLLFPREWWMNDEQISDAKSKKKESYDTLRGLRIRKREQGLLGTPEGAEEELLEGAEQAMMLDGIKSVDGKKIIEQAMKTLGSGMIGAGGREPVRLGAAAQRKRKAAIAKPTF